MSDTPQLNLTTLHASIKSELTTAFPDVRYVDTYPRPGERINTPALLFELENIDVMQTGDVGTSQLPVTLVFNLYCVVSYKGTGKLSVRLLAASVLGWLKGKRFGQSIGPAIPSGADPDVLSGDPANEYEVFRISWRHEPCYLGASVWDSTGTVPTEVNVGFDPNTGTPHVNEYITITPEL